MEYREIVSLNNQDFEIWYDNPEDRIEALKEAQSQCSTCGLNVNTLVATGPSAAVVGETLSITSTPTQGTSPYTYTFWKVMDNAPTGTASTTIGTAPSGVSGTISYTVASEDVGSLRIGVDIVDSCPTGGTTSSEYWIVTVLSSCGTPIPNLTITQA